MPVELTENRAQVKVSISKGFGVLQLELQFECLYQVAERGSNLTCSSIVACEVVVGGGFEVQRLAGDELCLSQSIKRLLKVFLMQINHGSQIQVLTKFFRSPFKLCVVHAIHIFLDTNNFLHNINALVVFALSLNMRLHSFAALRICWSIG